MNFEQIYNDFEIEEVSEEVAIIGCANFEIDKTFELKTID